MSIIRATSRSVECLNKRNIYINHSITKKLEKKLKIIDQMEEINQPAKVELLNYVCTKEANLQIIRIMF